MPQPGWCLWDGDDLLLSLKVQPRASRDELIGPLGAQLKVRLRAPPIDGRANALLVRFLAKTFGVSRDQVRIERGRAGREKWVRIKSPARLPLILRDC